MKSMTKRLLSILLVLCMMLSVLPVAAFAEDGAEPVTAPEGTVAEEPKTAEPGEKAPEVKNPEGETSKDKTSKDKSSEDETSKVRTQKGGQGGPVWDDTKWFGYDSWSRNGDLSGIKSVAVGSTALVRNSASISADEAVKNGVRISFNEGWYLEKWKVVCADKYGCQTDAWGRATTATGVMTGAGAAYYDVAITNDMMNHSNNSRTYWLLLALKQDNKNYTVSYNWGTLTGKLNSSVPAGGSYKVNAVVPVAVPSDAAVAEARALGYEFDGWTMSYGDKSSDVAGGSSFAMPQANVTLTAKWKTATTSFTVTKVWEDNNNSAQKRPDSITVLLRRNGADYTTAELNAANNWTHTWNDLPKMVDGAAVSYTADELTVPQGYTKDATYVGNSCIITNTYIGDTIDIKITKIWDDNSNQDGKRPQFIKINLLADGVVDKSIEISTYSVNNTNMVGFNRRPVYNGDGKKIEYTVGEETVPAGYQATVTGSAEEGFTITNTHVPEKITISGSKRWDDHDDQDGKRPNSITVNLLADGEKVDSKVVTAANGWEWSFEADKYKGGKEITYTITEDTVEGYTSSVTGDQAMGFTITNTHTPETITISGEKHWNNDTELTRPASITVYLNADGEQVDEAAVTAGADGKWTYSFKNMPKYAGGKEIVYTITEASVPGYEFSTAFGTDGGNKYDIINTYNPGKTSVTVQKTWDDDNDRDGLRPDSVKVQLKNGLLNVGDPVELNERNQWTYTFNDLDATFIGIPILYTVEEVNVPEGYKAEVTGDRTAGFTITNTHTPETTKVSVEKKWDDENDTAGFRPESVEVMLYAVVGRELAPVGDSVTLNAGNKWKYTWENLPANENGEKITYTVDEAEVKNYTKAITGDQTKGFTVTNTHTPEKMKVTVTKTWDDGDDQDGLRPNSVKVTLYRNGTEVGKATLNVDNNWSYTFTDMPVYAEGQKAIYTVTEASVENYQADYSHEEGENELILKVFNTYTPKMTSIDVTKKWTDNNNKAGARPKSVTIYLLADGKKTGDELVLSADNKWTGSFKDLPVNKDGKAIKYTISEKSVSKYKAKITGSAEKGFVVTNTHTSIPTTGDQSNMTMYMMLFALGAAAVVTALILGRKKNGGYGGKYARRG